MEKEVSLRVKKAIKMSHKKDQFVTESEYSVEGQKTLR
jgi:hypothetical protein